MSALPFIALFVTAAVSAYGAIRNRRSGDRIVYGVCAASSVVAAVLLLAGA